MSHSLNQSPHIRFFYVLRMLGVVIALLLGTRAHALSAGVVISQVYGGGGNAGAQFNSDFIELFNRGSTAVDVTGWSVQYAPDTGSTWDVVPLTGALGAGQYYLIRLGNGGAAGAALPTPVNASLLTLNINATAGKVALVNNLVPLTVTAPGSAAVIDLLGYGPTANGFEAAPTPALTNTSSAFRAGLGCHETDNNLNDFLVRTPPLPRNTATAAYSCVAVLLGYYPFEDAAWAVGTGVVKDLSGNNRNGNIVGVNIPTLSPAAGVAARTGNVGSCGYGVFASPNTSTGRILIPNLPVSTALGAQTTVSFWMRWNGVQNVMPIGWQAYDLWFTSNGFGFNTNSSDVWGISSATLANVWRHVTVVFTNGARLPNSMYIDGTLQNLTPITANALNVTRAVVDVSLRVGGFGANDSYKFTGNLDELKIYNGELTQAQVTANFLETHPCGPVLALQKTVTVLCDPVNGVTNPKNIPGALVQYSIIATNTGSKSASLTQVSDTVSSSMVFDNNLITGVGASPASACNSATGTPSNAVGRGFSLDVTGDTRGASYPKFLTSTNADADGASHNASNILINYPIALPAEAGYTAGEIKPTESVVVKFNAVVQ
jgi:hypothetical protein